MLLQTIFWDSEAPKKLGAYSLSRPIARGGNKFLFATATLHADLYHPKALKLVQAIFAMDVKV